MVLSNAHATNLTVHFKIAFSLHFFTKNITSVETRNS